MRFAWRLLAFECGAGRECERVNVRERSIADVPTPLLGRRALL